MRTSDVVDLANERRLSAVLEFADHGAELLVLNGGSRAEELTIETTVSAPVRRERRAAYCVDSGTSMQLVFPLLHDEHPADVVVRILGGPQELLLAPPPRPHIARTSVARGAAALAAAAVLVVGAFDRLDPSSFTSVAYPVPAAAEAPLVTPQVAMHTETALPTVVTRPAVVPVRIAASLPARLPRVRDDAVVRPVQKHVVIARAAAPKASQRRVPEPRLTDLRVPTTAKSGDIVPIAFSAIADKVKIIATIGPTIVARLTVPRGSGLVAIRPPKSDRDGRVMMVRAYAENGNRVAIQQAMVVLVRPE